MPRTVNYYFFVSSVTAGENGLMTIRRDGKILGTKMSAAAVGGGIGRCSSIFKINDSVSVSTLADPPPEGILNAISFGTSALNEVRDTDTGFVPADIPVRAGDRMTLNQITAGTAPSFWQTHVLVTVRE